MHPIPGKEHAARPADTEKGGGGMKNCNLSPSKTDKAIDRKLTSSMPSPSRKIEPATARHPRPSPGGLQKCRNRVGASTDLPPTELPAEKHTKSTARAYMGGSKSVRRERSENGHILYQHALLDSECR